MKTPVTFTQEQIDEIFNRPYDCVENHMKCFMGEEIEEYHFKHNMVIARKYEEFITATDINVDYCKTNG